MLDSTRREGQVYRRRHIDVHVANATTMLGFQTTTGPPRHVPTYCYPPLRDGYIRLLLLLPPHPDQCDSIRCQLIEYPLQDSWKGTHPYEALSYSWGSEKKPRSIFIDGEYKSYLCVTENLHAALLRLRDCSLPRILWIDAICINQDNNEERTRQVQFMAKIYARASRVIVWLEEETPDRKDITNGDRALEIISDAAVHDRPTESPRDQDAVLTLLERSWFQRIWLGVVDSDLLQVLQEVAAARHVVIISRTAEIDGYAFCSGWNSLKLTPKEPGTQSRIRSTTYLIKGAFFWPKHATSCSDRFSLHIRPLGELMDMYHDRKASNLRDKIYALLGMSSDLPVGKTPDYPDGIMPDYGRPWKELFCHLVKSLVGEQATVTTWDEKEDDKEIAIIKSKACVLGNVSENPLDDRVGITWTSHFATKEKQSSYFTVPTLAKPVEVGDVVCLLQGASKPTIVRPRNGYSTIIMIAVSGSSELQRTVTTFPNDILLVWDWKVSQIQSQVGGCYEGLISSQDGSKCRRAECNCQDLDKAIRSWNIGLLLNAAERYEEAGKDLREAINFYGTAISNNHGLWSEADEEALRVMHFLLIKDKGAIIEAECKDGRTPLLWAARKGYEAVVQQLLEKGAAIEATDKEGGRTPLLWAARNGYETVVQQLLEKGAAIEATDRWGRTPLLLAAKNGHKAVVQQLLKNGHKAVVQQLLKKGAAIEATDKEGRTPLLLAAKNGYKAVVQQLLKKGAAIEARDKEGGWTPLLWAAKNGYKAVVQQLLEKGAVIEATDRWGQTPLLLAAKNGYEAVIQQLLEKGAAIEATDKEGWTPLLLAAKNGHKAVIQQLLEKGAVIEATDKEGWTPLLWAAKNGYKAVVQQLLEKGAAIEATDRWGWTPLSWAARNGHKAVVQQLLEKGAAIKATDKEGRTPLLWAARNGYKAIIQQLLEKGAAIEAMDKEGWTPLLLAAKNGYEAVVQQLLEKGAAIEATDRWGWTPLLWAARKGHEAVVQQLLEKGAAIEATDRWGRTPLSWAARNGHEAVVQQLLEKGAVIEATDKEGRTPLSWAAENGHEATVQRLLSHVGGTLPAALTIPQYDSTDLATE
ncbi:hypothetical protein RRF57_005255 [Xylaria bambusicola]|uniref:Heterokaryon incompatibility domain-containing protein n=1 Tax=Xylaria bambusicola TaxID=326684 RepID=A0AAN7YXM1_9PEZI